MDNPFAANKKLWFNINRFTGSVNLFLFGVFGTRGCFEAFHDCARTEKIFCDSGAGGQD
jgi:hypothetical protein